MRLSSPRTKATRNSPHDSFFCEFLPFVLCPRNFARNFGEVFALAREIYAIFLAEIRAFLNEMQAQAKL
jgi:hypothetical protein